MAVAGAPAANAAATLQQRRSDASLHRFLALFLPQVAIAMQGRVPECQAHAHRYSLQGLDAHRGAEKERIIFETAFRSVQADRPDPLADANTARPDRATLHVPARALAARAQAAHAQTSCRLRRGGARLLQRRRGLQGKLIRPLAAQAHTFASL